MAKAKEKKREKKRGISLNIVLLLQLLIMLGLSLAITKIVSDRTTSNADAYLSAVTEERGQVIMNYVETSERQLLDYSKATQIINLLKDPENEELIDEAQKFTTAFAKDVPYLEGVYTANWDTQIMVSSLTQSVGKNVGKDSQIPSIQQAMLNKRDQVSNGGILYSPFTGRQVTRMFMAVYGDNNDLLGMVGMDIYTSGLIETLDRISGYSDKTKDEDAEDKAGDSVLSNSFYYLMRADNATYLFNENNVGENVPIAELHELCDKFAEKEEDQSGQVSYTDDYKKDHVAGYVYLSKYGWIFTINVPKSDFYAMTYAMRVFLGAFGAIIVMLTVVFFFINKRQERINQKLVSTLAKNAQTRQSLNTAMFKDVLTNANNRVSFSMDMESSDISAQKPGYFMMFNILGFSEINTMYGSDAGDRLLVRTVETLNEIFPDRAVYRTGSDEFVVMIPTEGGQPAPEQVLNDVNTAFRQLMVPEKVENMGAIYPKYKIAVIKRNGTADTSVVTALKDMTNRRGEATYGMIDYREM